MLQRKYLYGTRDLPLLCPVQTQAKMLCCQMGKKPDPRFGERDGSGGCPGCKWGGKNVVVYCLGVFWGVFAWGFLHGLRCPLVTAAEVLAGSQSPQQMQVAELALSLQPGCSAHPAGWRCLKSSPCPCPNFANVGYFCSVPSSCSQTI